MDYNKKIEKNTIQKTLRIPIDIYEVIEKQAKEQERDVSKQINYMLKKAIELTK